MSLNTHLFLLTTPGYLKWTALEILATIRVERKKTARASETLYPLVWTRLKAVPVNDKTLECGLENLPGNDLRRDTDSKKTRLDRTVLIPRRLSDGWIREFYRWDSVLQSRTSPTMEHLVGFVNYPQSQQRQGPGRHHRGELDHHGCRPSHPPCDERGYPLLCGFLAGLCLHSTLSLIHI